MERDRTTSNGELSQYPYPKNIGNEATNPWITTDFLEAMTEVVTPPAKDDLTTLRYSYKLTTILRKNLARNEILWPLSMPPVLPQGQDEELLAKASPKKRAYIEGLYHRYGLSQQTSCGVHINVSLSKPILDFITKHKHFTNVAEAQNYIYPLIAQGFIKYHWLLTYLLGASPVAQANYFKDGQGPQHPIRSIRQSKYGYPTSFSVDYSSVDKYVDKIMSAVKDGKIMSIAEFYGAVRFKGPKDLNQLKSHGIKYLELRMFDLDPTSEVALKLNTLRLIRLMIVYFTMSQPPKDIQAELLKADEMNARVALERPDQPCEFQSEGQKFVDQLRKLVNYLELGPEYLETLNHVEDQLKDPKLTLNGYLQTQIRNHSLLDFGLKKAKQYQTDGLESHVVDNIFKDNDGHISTTELTKDLNN